MKAKELLIGVIKTGDLMWWQAAYKCQQKSQQNKQL